MIKSLYSQNGLVIHVIKPLILVDILLLHMVFVRQFSGINWNSLHMFVVVINSLCSLAHGRPWPFFVSWFRVWTFTWRTASVSCWMFLWMDNFSLWLVDNWGTILGVPGTTCLDDVIFSAKVYFKRARAPWGTCHTRKTWRLNFIVIQNTLLTI